MSNNNDYFMNVTRVRSLGENISTESKEYSKLLGEIVSMIDDLSGHWEGETYNAFRQNFYKYVNDLDSLERTLKSFSDDINRKANKTQNKINRIKQILGGK